MYVFPGSVTSSTIPIYPSSPLGLQASNSQSGIELLLTRPELLNSLRKAHMGNYSIILSLLGCLEHGLKAKKLVDIVVDSCAYLLCVPSEAFAYPCILGDQVTNLREDIFMHRIRYSLTSSMDEGEREMFLDKAIKSLEK